MVGCPSAGLVHARQPRHRVCLLTARDLSTHGKTFGSCSAYGKVRGTATDLGREMGGGERRVNPSDQE